MMGQPLDFTPRTKRVLELSYREARRMGHNYIGTEHLLLGIMKEGESVAVRILKDLGVEHQKLVQGRSTQFHRCAKRPFIIFEHTDPEPVRKRLDGDGIYKPKTTLV